MCEMIQKIKDESEANGIVNGKAEGFKLGKEEGQKEGFLNALFSLVQKGLLSLDDAAKQAGISKAKFQKLMPQV